MGRFPEKIEKERDDRRRGCNSRKKPTHRHERDCSEKKEQEP
jgi:hypothetical protein